MPTLEGGLYMDLIAEDGNLYPFPVTQYGVELPAAKTIDAVLNVGADGTYALYDRALNLTNGLGYGRRHAHLHRGGSGGRCADGGGR